MGKVILFGSEKGGTGKSTLATNTAAYLALQNKDVILVDADKQRTSTTWGQDRESCDRIKTKVSSILAEGNIRAALMSLRDKYEYVVVDCAGRDSIELRTGMTAADVMISPLRPSQFDLDTLPRLLQVFEEASIINPSLKAYLVINQAPTNPFISEAQAAESVLKEYEEFNLVDAVIYDRKIYRDCASEGMSIFESKNEKAKEDLEKMLSLVVI